MRISNFFNAMRGRAKRIARSLVTAASVVALSTAALSAQAANIYGPPGLQPNQIGGGGSADSWAAVSADFNNDGYTDLAVINRNTGDLAIYTANAIGTLTLSHDYGIFNFVQPNAIVAGDVNGDGKIDLVITDDLGVSVLLGVGNATASFTAASPQRPALADSNSGVTNPQLADLNHDGKLDIVVGVRDPGNFGGTAYFEVLQGIVGGKFILVGQYEVPYSGVSGFSGGGESRLADIDGDGELDLVFKNSVSGTGVSWMKGVGNGQFLPHALLLGVGTGAGLFNDLQAVDVDGDGKVDLLMLNQYGNGVWMAKGNGNGSFQATKHLYATGVPSGNGRDMGPIIVADVNGDGRLDIVADGYVLLQQADHSFVFNEHIGYSETRMLTAIDLNHDGRSDLITAGPGAGKIAIFETVTGAASSVTSTGSPQSTVFNTAFGQPLSVKVTDSSNVVVPNVQVIFSLSTVGGVASANGFVGLTNASGIVNYTPTANGGLGCYQMKATITGLNVVPLFNLCNTGANDLTVTSGDNQTTLVGTAFGTQLQVKLTDPSNNPKAGVTVSFGGPSVPSRVVLSAPTAVTNANGFAAVNATATGKSGAYSVSVTAPGATPTSIKLTNSSPPGAAASVAFVLPTPQYAYVTQPFSDPITARVLDFFGNPIQGATVVFAITPDATTGATASFSALTAVTNASGDAQVSATANGFVGTFSVKASVPASLLVSPQSRLLRNIADLPKFMTLVSGTPQSTPVNTTFAQKLRVKVTAWDSSVTPQVRVYFLSTGGAVLSAASALADATGIAEVTATADATVGSYQVGAIVYDTVLEQPITQTFNLTNTAAAALPVLAVANASIVEGNAGTKVLNFPVTLAAASPVDVVITYSTTDGTATTANNDYVAVINGTVTIAAGQLTGNLPVTINGDTTVEPNETFTVSISDATNAVLSNATAIGTILNDDVVAPALPVVSVGNASIVEGNVGTSVLNFPVTLSIAAPAGGVTLTYSTANGTATAGSDYVAVAAGSVTIPAGALTGSLPVTINGDTVVEPDETLTVAINGATNATLGTVSATGTIVNDDVLVPLATVVPVPVNHPLALFALMLALLGFAWRRAAR